MVKNLYVLENNMKPIILVEKNGKVILSKEDLQNIIEDAYEEGKKDGRNSNSYYCNWYFCPYRNRDTWNWPKVTYKTTTDATINTAYNPKNVHTCTTATTMNEDDHTTT